MGYGVTMVDLFRFMGLYGPENSDEEDCNKFPPDEITALTSVRRLEEGFCMDGEAPK